MAGVVGFEPTKAWVKAMCPKPLGDTPILNCVHEHPTTDTEAHIHLYSAPRSSLATAPSCWGMAIRAGLGTGGRIRTYLSRDYKSRAETILASPVSRFFLYLSFDCINIISYFWKIFKFSFPWNFHVVMGRTWRPLVNFTNFGNFFQGRQVHTITHQALHNYRIQCMPCKHQWQ